MSSLPSTQKALLLHAKDGPFVLSTVPVPNPGPHDILVRVESAAINPIDALFQLGEYVHTYPFTPGMDAAGVVAAIGQDVTRFAVGDKVFVQIYSSEK
jgi:NADPH:quinone reductase-like Zn-dependent oxidoreductase